jgi:hypothetical protein
VGPALQDFGILGFQIPNHHTQQLLNLKGERMWDHHFRILGFGILGFQIPNHNTHQLLNLKGERMWDHHFGILGFRDFWGFKYQTTIHNNSQIPKGERMWDHHFGIWVSGRFQGFKYQTTIHNNSRILKGERMWDHHFGISGFGISGFQIPNHNTQQFLNFEKVKGCGTNTSGFRVSGGFRVSNVKPQYTTIPEF